eukprot:TRINITY_DN8168_c0_g1_i1.p1 TRINITY_DN8168_c0_g1~~TRINITY_DN8168_c0_g1_i1.p1  ORF type:complete len:104 (-),score=17.47 TRINITY_DN8168_c0_g1_i1:66-377(-)
MPLCVPQKTNKFEIGWETTRQDFDFILQHRKTQAKKPQYRILLRCNRFVVADAEREEDIFNDWEALHPYTDFGELALLYNLNRQRLEEVWSKNTKELLRAKTI